MCNRTRIPQIGHLRQLPTDCLRLALKGYIRAARVNKGIDGGLWRVTYSARHDIQHFPRN